MEKYVQLNNGVFLSDRFVGGYDPKVCDFYVEDKYVSHRYFRESDEYHMALITLLNDRQGYINFIIDFIKKKMECCENDEYCRKIFRNLLNEIESP